MSRASQTKGRYVGFTRVRTLVAGAREVPDHGSIDNLYLTPAGDIVLVETKLWRNGQMRRDACMSWFATIPKLS